MIPSAFNGAATTFTGMTRADVALLIRMYLIHVQLEDTTGLKDTLSRYPSLTPANRSWMANNCLGLRRDNDPSGAREQIRLTDYAIARKNHALLGFLLEEGAFPDLAMPAALLAKDSEAVKLLCAANADPDASIHGVPLLHVAAAHFDAASCRELLLANADVNAGLDMGRGSTALHSCISVHFQRLCKTTDMPPLRDGTYKNALRTMGVLLSHNANPYKVGMGGMSTYQIAQSFQAVDPLPFRLICGALRSRTKAEMAVRAAAQTTQLLSRFTRNPGGPAPG